MKRLIIVFCAVLIINLSGCGIQNDKNRDDMNFGDTPKEVSSEERATVSEEKPSRELLASIEDEDIYLYMAYPQYAPGGVVLSYKGRETLFDWMAMTPRGILPTMKYYDFDNDGDKELAITLYIGSGTGVSIEDLHILEIDNSKLPVYEDYYLNGFDASIWLGEIIEIKGKVDEENVIISLNSSEYTVKSGENDESGQLVDIHIGQSVSFEFDGNRIKTTIGVGFEYENWVPLAYCARIDATVVYCEGGFLVEDYSLKVLEEFRVT